MKKILLITGRNAVRALRDIQSRLNMPTEIFVCNTDVASLISPSLLLKELSNVDLSNISEIIVPGSTKGDFSVIQDKFNIPCLKGPRNLSDLPTVINTIKLSNTDLSPDMPADEILDNEIKKVLEEELKNAHYPEKYRIRIGKKGYMQLYSGGIMHIIAEIPDVPLLDESELKRITNYYEKSGASIIDIGMVANDDYSKKIPSIVKILRSCTKLPLSIDSLNESEILAALDSDIDMIMSLDMGNYRILEDINGDIRNTAVVIIPRDKGGRIPKDVNERIELIEKLIEYLKDIELSKIIADPILNPPNHGLFESLMAFYILRHRYSNLPLLMGVGNVTELMDADSVGINALISLIASELDIDFLFTTEASRKTKGCIKELSRAVKMMYLSRRRRQTPKDLGIDLLYLKDKRSLSDMNISIKNLEIEKIPLVVPKNEIKSRLENARFHIYVDENTDSIEVIYYKDKKPELRFRGNNAEGLYKGILSRNLIQDYTHAAYLGMELGKAEIALKLGKNYIQDEPLF